MRIVTIVTLALAFILLVLCGYWLLWPYKILTNGQPDEVVFHTQILTPVVPRGGNVVFATTLCKHYDMPEISYRELIDGFVYTLPAVQSFRPVGCQNTHGAVPIPHATPQGYYHLSTTIEFRPNPIRVVRYVMDTPLFLVQ